MPRWDRSAAVLTAAAAIMLVPWTVGIAAVVPHTAMARHWNTAWAGLDAALAAGLAATCWLRRRRDHRAAPAATATATLMCADAWFDMCTSPPGSPFALAAVFAATELVVAAACLRLGHGPGRRHDREPDRGPLRRHDRGFQADG